MDIVIPIVFPDYLIGVSTPKLNVKIPDVLPFVDVFPDYVRIPATKHKLPELGHAGVLFINGRTGTTKYYEYGRYDRAALGLTRRVPVPDVKLSAGGMPAEESLTKVLAAIARKAGQNGRIRAAFISLPDGSFGKMLGYARRRVSENGNPKRTPYSMTGNSCMHFSKKVAEAGGAAMPWIVDPRPKSFIEEVQSTYPPLDFKPPKDLMIQGVTGY